MSKTDELSRKDMKEPDKFQAAAGEAASWLTGHRRQTTLALAGAFGLLILVVVVTSMKERSAVRSGALLAEVYQAADGELSSVPLPGQAGPFFASDAERQKAVVTAAAKVQAEAPSTAAATAATLAKGDAHLRLGELDAATAAYQAYLSAAPKGDSLRFGALEGLAVIEESKGQVDAALAAWSRLAAEVPAQADRADLAKARLLASSGKKEEAKALLVAFAEAHKTSSLASEASDRLAKLGGK